MHRIARISLSLLAAAGLGASARAEQAQTPEQAISRLLGQGLGRAHDRLHAKYAFLPFALVLHKDGTVEQIGPGSGDIFDAQQDDTLEQDPAKVLAELQQQVIKESKTRADVVAVGFFSDTEIKLPDGSDSQAIQAEMEHAAGGCTTVYEPFNFMNDQSLAYGAQIRTKRKGIVFPCP